MKYANDSFLIPTDEREAVLLLSGGLDSATTLGLFHAYGWTTHTLAVNYGQRNAAAELDAAQRIAKHYGTDHRKLELDLTGIAASPLTRSDPDGMPPVRTLEEQREFEPSPWIVPFRNPILLSLAFAWAETLKVNHVAFGPNMDDHFGFPDCRIPFVAAFDGMARLALDRAVTLLAPLTQMRKEDVVQVGHDLGVPFSETITCYAATLKSRACGRCDSCMVRMEAFEVRGLKDPHASGIG